MGRQVRAIREAIKPKRQPDTLKKVRNSHILPRSFWYYRRNDRRPSGIGTSFFILQYHANIILPFHPANTPGILNGHNLCQNRSNEAFMIANPPPCWKGASIPPGPAPIEFHCPKCPIITLPEDRWPALCGGAGQVGKGVKIINFCSQTSVMAPGQM